MQSWRAFYNAALQPESGKFKRRNVSRETGGLIEAPGTLFHVKQIRQEMNLKNE
jgi:hypothetical protein